MNLITKQRSFFLPGERTGYILREATVIIFILLFMYTATSKIFTFREFNNTLYMIPLFGPYHQAVAVFIIASEIVIGGLLIVPSTKWAGLYATLLLMVIFTVYLIYMVSYAVLLPCSCGGITVELSWKNHIWLNICLIVLLSVCLLTKQNKQQL